MSSIFDLKTNVEELDSANQGTSRMSYDQHPPTRDVTTANFPNGAIHFRFQTAGQKWWVPGRSYLRTRVNLTKADGSPLALADNVAPNMGLCASLFQSAEFRINDKVVSRIGDFMPQIDSLETRLSKSKSWVDSVGNSSNLWQVKYAERQAVVAEDGVSLDAVEVQRLGATELGIGAATTIAIGDETGVATFSAAHGQNILNGDVIVIGNVKYLVSNNSLSNDTMKVSGSKTIAVAATNAWYVERTINNARKVGQFELIWTPPLSIFKLQHALPSGKYELVLNPQTSSAYQRYAIESLNDKTPGTDYKFEVADMYFYCNSVEGPRADDITYLLDLEQTNCQSDKIDNASFAQKNFDVSPSTYALSVAYQDLRAGNNTAVSSSKFRSYNAALTASQELALERFFINYAGQNMPAPDADPQFNANIDRTTQRYMETMLYNGAVFDTGGAETIEEFHARGSYYYFAIPRDGTDRSTRVAIHSGFRTGADVANMRVLLFAHSKQVARVRVADGRVVDVALEDA